jgi:hypothetical protein
VAQSLFENLRNYLTLLLVQLKEAFAAGLLKPGLNVVGEAPAKKQFKNNVTALKQKLAEVKKDLPWVGFSLIPQSNELTR